MTGTDIRTLRNQMGLTQKQLADRMAVYWTVVQRWETDRMGISKSNQRLLQLIAQQHVANKITEAEKKE